MATRKKTNDNGPSNRRSYWQEEITKSNRRYERFTKDGNVVIDRYLLERESGPTDVWQDRYNILYSSTETTSPSLYSQTPKVQATKRHQDRESDKVTYAVMLLEAIGQYALEDVDFDGVMKNVVKDYLLPGIGQAWCRYVPQISKTDDNTETLDFEGLGVDYVHFNDFRTGVARTWLEMPWVARRVYFDKHEALQRFEEGKANRLSYSYQPNSSEIGSRQTGPAGDGDQAVIWEIWNKRKREVVWFSEDYPDDVLDVKPDFLKLKDFWPCPEPIRAVWNTRSFVPKAFYSQYKAQAQELDNITERIRHLTQALRVVGVYDSSQETLKQILSGTGNKMVGVANWSQFASTGGIAGAIQFVPIKEVAEVLTQLFGQREIVKNEIYEITGFSDIVRGVSKASETLGAQKIKSDWARGRLGDMQKEVQRFCRDMIRIMTEIMLEQFQPESLALYAGFEPPPITPEEQAAAAQYAMAVQQMPQTVPGQPPQPMPQKPGPTVQAQAIQMFEEVVKLVKSEKQRCAVIGVETDSTIQPDEAAEREDRMTFLSSAGAFLQQAGPMALQFPEMRGLLGSILMFTIRTFRASRPLEKEFEDFTKKLAAAPPTPPPGQGEAKADPQAQAAADMPAIQAKLQGDAAIAQAADATKRYEIDTKAKLDQMKLQQDHEYRMAQLALQQSQLELERQKLGIDAAKVQVTAQGQEHSQALAVEDQQHSHALDFENLDRQDDQNAVQQEQGERQLDQADRAQEIAAEQASQGENEA